MTKWHENPPPGGPFLRAVWGVLVGVRFLLLLFWLLVFGIILYFVAIA